VYVLENMPWFVLLIGVLVFFHELGHFLIAKLFGVKVLCFSIGFGPRLLGFRYGETDYQVSLLPLGGYVRLLGQLPGSDVAPADEACALYAKPLYQRSAILFAGPFFNFLLAFFIYWAMFTGLRTFGDTRLGVVTEDGPAWQAGLRPGDKVTAIDGRVLGDWGDLQEAISARPGEALAITFERDGATGQATLRPERREGADLFDQPASRGHVGISLLYVTSRIGVIDAASPAAQAGLRTGDRLIEVGGRHVEAWQEVRAALASASGAIAVRYKRAGIEQRTVLTPSGPPIAEGFSGADAAGGYTGLVSQESLVAEVEPATPAQEMGLQVGDRLLRLETDGGVKPIAMWAIDLGQLSGTARFRLHWQRGTALHEGSFELLQRTETDELRHARTRYIFGAKNAEDTVDTYQFDRTVGWGAAAVEAATQVGSDAALIGKGLGMLLRGMLPLDNVGGAVMLFVIAEKSAERGWRHFLRMMALISVNLGLLNLLPIPALDGGHLMFYALEAVRRRPPSARLLHVANTVGFALLVLLMLVVLRNDILRYVLQ
jgi:regulator of sigma E protease